MSDVIEIYCDDASHEGRRWVVARLTRDDSEDQPWWKPAEGNRSLRGSEVVQFLDEDTALTGRATLKINPASVGDGQPVGERLRVRYRLRCRLCGLAVSAREDKAKSVFDKLAANDVRALALRALAAIV
jgi:hypothetical protein